MQAFGKKSASEEAKAKSKAVGEYCLDFAGFQDSYWDNNFACALFKAAEDTYGGMLLPFCLASGMSIYGIDDKVLHASTPHIGC